MRPCDSVLSISAIACYIYGNFDLEEVGYLSLTFSQLGIELSHLLARKELADKSKENIDENLSSSPPPTTL